MPPRPNLGPGRGSILSASPMRHTPSAFPAPSVAMKSPLPAATVVPPAYVAPPMPGAPWVASTSYPVGITVTMPDGSTLQAVVAGTSGTYPPYGMTPGAPITDNTVTWVSTGSGYGGGANSSGGGGGANSDGGGSGANSDGDDGSDGGSGLDAYGADDGSDGTSASGADPLADPLGDGESQLTSADTNTGSGLDLLGCDEVGHGGGGGGHGGGGHGGHGGGRGGRGYGGPLIYGGSGWGDDTYVVDGWDVDAYSPDDIAKAVVRRLKTGSNIGYAAPETHWYSIATPGDILAEMDKVQREADTLDHDFESYSGGDSGFPATKSAWKAFLAEYKKFYEDNNGWFSRLSGGMGDRVVAYGNQLNDWRAKLKSFAGAKVTEPSLTAVQVREDPTKTNYKPYLIGGMVIAGLLGGGYALSKLALFKKSAA